MNFNEYNEHSAHQILDIFFSSDIWEQITIDANDGDVDSISLMSQISEQLASLTWHLQNNSGEDRIRYEMNYFNELCEDFGLYE